MRYQFHPERVWQIGFGLPQERSHIVIERAFTSALEIDEIRFPILYHHVTALEVAVQEGGRGTAHQNFGHVFEFIFQLVFLKLQTGSFQKTVFEIIQVPQNGTLVEFRLRVTNAEVKSVSSGKLDAWQHTQGLAKQFFFFFTENPGQPSLFDSLEELEISQVFLQVAAFVFSCGIDFRYREVLFLEMAVYGQESMIFFVGCTDDTNQRLWTFHSEIAPVGTGSRQFFYVFRPASGKRFI